MKHLTKLILIAMIGILSLMLVTGCSDDDKATNNITQGDPNNANYQNARNNFDSMFDDLTGTLGRGTGYLGGFNPPQRAASTVDTTYSGYDTTSGWWYYYEDGEDQYGVYEEYDSVRYSYNGDPIQYPEDDIDKMELIFFSEVVYDDGTTSLESTDIADWVWSVFGDTLDIDGFSYITFDLGEEVGSFDYTEDFINVRILEDADYPHSGSMSIDMTMEYFNPDDQQTYSVIFTFTLTFYEDYMHVYLSDGTYYWEWDEYYEEG